jgi:uncharacterized membrane protein YgaE (UPF0421/DUF939 family)
MSDHLREAVEEARRKVERLREKEEPRPLERVLHLLREGLRKLEDRHRIRTLGRVRAEVDRLDREVYDLRRRELDIALEALQLAEELRDLEGHLRVPPSSSSPQGGEG